MITPEETAMATPPPNQPSNLSGNNPELSGNNDRSMSALSPEQPLSIGDNLDPEVSPARVEDEEEPSPYKKNIVIADFFLPGCCTFDDDCNTMCVSPEEMKALMIPPVAKSDYVTTSANVAVNVRVLINDDPITGDTLEIVPTGFTPTSLEGGKVDLSADGTFFIYTPPGGETPFTGVDKFVYTIRNTVNRLTDTATVYINVAEGNTTIIVEPTISVASQFCAADKANAQMIPITIDKGTYTAPNFVFTIQGEATKTWLVKLGDANYAIDTSKITGNQSYILTLLRNGASVATTNFTVQTVTAGFDYITTPVGIMGGGEEFFAAGSGDFLRTTESNTSEFNSLNTRIISPLFNLYTLTLYNQSSQQANNFTWQLLNTNNAVVGTQITTNRNPVIFQNIYETWFTLGYKIRLTATSSAGCVDTLIIPLLNKPTLSEVR
ncbi:MAG: Ig-like domain-containing protein [Bacteroidia bacterium]|nr:Ig-like domain-containing protein [Bacteroidia bacterium]